MSKITLPKTDAEWDAWEAEEARKDEEYFNRVFEKDPYFRGSSTVPPNSSKSFDLESFKKTARIVVESYTGSVC